MDAVACGCACVAPSTLQPNTFMSFHPAIIAHLATAASGWSRDVPRPFDTRRAPSLLVCVKFTAGNKAKRSNHRVYLYITTMACTAPLCVTRCFKRVQRATE